MVVCSCCFIALFPTLRADITPRGKVSNFEVLLDWNSMRGYCKNDSPGVISALSPIADHKTSKHWHLTMTFSSVMAALNLKLTARVMLMIRLLFFKNNTVCRDMILKFLTMKLSMTRYMDPLIQRSGSVVSSLSPFNNCSCWLPVMHCH